MKTDKYANKIKEMFSVDEIKMGINEIEQYLDITAENINISLNERKHRKPKEKRKIKVDNSWRFKTASREIKFKLRKLSKHM